MKNLTDFAVICKGATVPHENATLRVFPIQDSLPLVDAVKGAASLIPKDVNGNMPRNDAGDVLDNVISVQHRSGGYCRMVAKLVAPFSGDVNGSVGDLSGINNAKGFVLAEYSEEVWKPVAVASIDAGIDLTKPELYVAFTFSKTNNYQSVSFSPNAFATLEDLNAINGLDGLHIAFDHMSGDIKLLDKDGKVLDQANLHMDADTIIADGEEGYKYVKTDIQQDIHAEKDFMPAGKTAGADVQAKQYEVKNACFLVDAFKEPAIAGAMSSYFTASNAFTQAEKDFESARATYNQRLQALEAGTEGVTQEQVEEALADVKSKLKLMQAAQETVKAASEAQMQTFEDIKPRIIHGESPAVVGIRVYSTTGEGADADKTYKDYIVGGKYLNKVTNVNGTFLVETASITPTPIPDIPDSGAIDEQYSPDAFVWTVGSDAGKGTESDTFAQKMNAAAQSMGFHVGDDIPLGTNIATLLGDSADHMSSSGGFDAQKYMHDGDENNYAEVLINEQRNNAKEELVAWNAQHPALIHDPLNGTRISSDGLDVRNGKIEIGNGVANDDEESVKRYVIETDIADSSAGARADKGLQIGVIDSQSSLEGSDDIVYSDVKKDILTINAEDYISGAPTCLALLKCSKSGDPAVVSASLTGGRITANFNASGAEVDGVFSLTIEDLRANNGFGDVPRIVEIIPVYKSGADASEAVPAQRSISAIATATLVDNKSTLSIQCSQVIDWAASLGLGEQSGAIVMPKPTESGTDIPAPDPMPAQSASTELYLIVKVY